jgi:hypothetical protein
MEVENAVFSQHKRCQKVEDLYISFRITAIKNVNFVLNVSTSRCSNSPSLCSAHRELYESRTTPFASYSAHKSFGIWKRTDSMPTPPPSPRCSCVHDINGSYYSTSAGKQYCRWLRHYATSRRLRVRFPMSLNFLNWSNPYSRTMGLLSTQPLIEISINKCFWK